MLMFEFVKVLLQFHNDKPALTPLFQLPPDNEEQHIENAHLIPF